jgi:hypothetical protein
MRSALWVLGSALCACGPHGAAPAPTHAATPAPIRTPAKPAIDACSNAALRLEVAAPGPSDARATFDVKWEGQGTGEPSRVVCVVVGTTQELFPRGEQRSFTIRAHPDALQRIVVDGRPHLMFVPPGNSIMFHDDPCFFYRLSGPNTEAWFVEAPFAYCAAPNAACRPGFVRAQFPGPIEDSLCGTTEHEIRRCVEEGEVRLVAQLENNPPPPSEPDGVAPIPIAALARGPMRFAPRSCGFVTLDTGGEVVALVLGAGERWALTLDADRHVTGRLVRR